MAGYELPEAPPGEYAPVVPFDWFMTYVFDWKQNQHIAVIGPTEQGKTNLIYHLLAVRKYVAYMAIKVRDSTLEGFASQGGYARVADWPPTTGRVRKRPASWEDMPRRLVWPDAGARRVARAEQQRVFHAMLDDIWRDGAACVVWDDFWYLVRLLGLEIDAKQMLLNARSNDSPQVIAAQRGAGNRMVELFDQPTWLCFARETDARNLQLLGPSNSIRRGFVANLDRYQFYVENTRTDAKYRITAPLLEASLPVRFTRCKVCGMADDFTGVPDREWHETRRDALLGRAFGWAALALAVLLVLTLIEKGVLAGWGDLVKPGHAHG